MLEDTNEKEKAYQGLIGAVTAASFSSSLFVVVVIIIIIIQFLAPIDLLPSFARRCLSIEHR